MQIVIIVVDTVISIHALLAESDEPATSRNDKHDIFLSTLSLRRATQKALDQLTRPTYFYPRSPCGERLFNPLKAFIILTFLSTLSLRRATDLQGNRHNTINISIHALLAESDPLR